METNSIYLLEEAYRAFRLKRYSESAVLLEKINLSSSYLRDPYPDLLLAISYLFTNRFDLAEKEINRMKTIDSQYQPLLQLQAFLAMKSARSSDAAVSSYVELSSKVKGDRAAKKALRRLRSAASFSSFQQKAKLLDYVDIPKPPKDKSRNRKGKPVNRYISRRAGFSFRKALIIISAAAAVSAAVAALFIYADIDAYAKIKQVFSSVASRFDTVPSDETVDMANISGPEYEMVRRINEKSVPEFYYSSQELQRDYDTARHLIKKGEHNRAVLILNKIFNSNAGMNVKEKTEFLIKYVSGSDDRKFEKIDFSEVTEKPYLFRGYALVWSGKAANVKNKNGKIIFNLMVDYREKDRFSGIADVFSENNSDIKNGDSVEVHGLFISALMESRRPYIQAREIKKL